MPHPVLKQRPTENIMAEMIGTFTLVAAVWSAAHIMCIPVANTSLNPARSTATAVFADWGALQQPRLFWAAPLIGGAIGGMIDKHRGQPS